MPFNCSASQTAPSATKLNGTTRTPNTDAETQPASSSSQSSTKPQPTSVTHTTTRTDLSLFYRVLRSVIRPLRPHLISFPDPLPGGSLPLKKRPKSAHNVSIVERKVTIPDTTDNVIPLDLAVETKHLDELYLYDFIPSGTPSSKHTSAPAATIYYFSGGGFQSFPSGEHWSLCSRLAKDLAPQHVKVVLVSYPLAPNSPASQSLPLLRRWLRTTALEPSTPGKVILMGDSSGANVALSLAFWDADLLAKLRSTAAKSREDATHADTSADIGNLERLVAVLAISPPTDLRNSNPDIAHASRLDPVLTTAITESAAATWSKGLPRDHPAFSFVRADMANLRDSGVIVHGVVGTYDCLAPDAMVFKGQCEGEGVKGSWLVWEGQMHCFPLTAKYGLREGMEGVRWVEDRVREVVEERQ